MSPPDESSWLTVVKTTEKITNGVIKVLSYISILVLLAMILFVTLDILSRSLLGMPVIGSIDICSAMLAIIVALGIAYTEHNDGHIEVRVFMDKLPASVQRPINIASALIGFVFWVIVAWECIQGALDAAREGAASGVLAIPIYPFPALIALGAFLLAVKLIFRMLTYYGALQKRKIDIEPEVLVG